MQPIPKYTLEFLIPEQKIENPEDLIIRTKALSPPTAKITPQILFLIEDLCKDYIFSLGKMFTELVKVRMCLSLKKGISFDNKKIQANYDEKTKGPAFAMPKTPEIQHLMKRNVSVQDRTEAYADLGTKQVAFIDPGAFLLWKAGLKNPLTIDVEMTGFWRTSQGGGLTTGFLRFPHMLGDLADRFKDKREQQAKICIVGPGLFTPEKGVPSCPQFVELFSLFPKSDFLMLDNDKPTLDRMENQFHKCKFAAYDPSMLRIYTTKIEENNRYAPPKYQALFQEMKATFADNALANPKVKEMLAGIGPLQPLMLKVDPDKINLREFDILTSTPEEKDKGTFDIVVATMSILLNFDNFDETGSTNPIFILQKFLELLSENGSLYLDSCLIDTLFETYGEKNMGLGIRYLEQVLGNQLSFEEVSLSDFSPNSVGKYATFLNFSLNIGPNSMPNVSTSSINVVTRTGTKVEAISEEERAELRQKLLEM